MSRITVGAFSECIDLSSINLAENIVIADDNNNFKELFKNTAFYEN